MSSHKGHVVIVGAGHAGGALARGDVEAAIELQLAASEKTEFWLRWYATLAGATPGELNIIVVQMDEELERKVQDNRDRLARLPPAPKLATRSSG